VPHLGVPHLVIGEADIGSAGFNQGMGIGVPQGIHDRRIGRTDGVVGVVVAIAPAIEDAENDRGDGTLGFSSP
jgi:hypothetical protein